jgi:3,4-dihydroxy 2-butanone 4-phosphate synthase/GTP cyclohydrolase II
MKAIGKRGKGVIVLLHGKGSGDDLVAMLNADETNATPAAKWDPRIYGIGAQILREVGVGKMRLLASPRKMPSMAGFGLEVCGYLSPEEA